MVSWGRCGARVNSYCCFGLVGSGGSRVEDGDEGGGERIYILRRGRRGGGS